MWKQKNAMATSSIIFYLFFAVPYIFVMYWLVKQDKKKYVWGLIVVTAIAIAGIVVSQRASRMALQNYEQRRIDNREIELQNEKEALEKKALEQN